MAHNLIHFVEKALNQGASRAEVKKVLIDAGWQEDEVRNALASFHDTNFVVAVPKRRPYTSAGEAFMYLLLFLTLYITAFSFGTLVFQFINRWLPDLAQNPYIYDSTSGTIRMSTSAIIIAFPVFLWMSWLLGKIISKNPEKRSSGVRKWLTYITLFIAADIIIGDLISLVYNLLGGELTLRFVLKVLTVGSIAGAIFGYYLPDIRKDEKTED
jgi:hypothetical protein